MASSSLHLVDSAAALRAIEHRNADEGAPGLRLAGLTPLLGDSGLPRGAVVEIGSPAGLGCASRVALASCAAAQRLARTRSHDGQSCWCAWIDATESLYAPGARRAGVDLDRLLVVRPTPAEVARTAVRVAASRVFSVVVVDRSGVPGAALPRTKTRWNLAVRRLALAIEGSDCTVLLLSRAATAQREALPTRLRLALSRPGLDRLEGRIARDRRGRHAGPVALDATALWADRALGGGDSTPQPHSASPALHEQTG